MLTCKIYVKHQEQLFNDTIKNLDKKHIKQKGLTKWLIPFLFV